MRKLFPTKKFNIFHNYTSNSMNNGIMKSSTSNRSFTEELKGTASEIIAQVRKLIREGNARRLIVENKKGKILFQTQLTAGVAGTALITYLYNF